MTSRDITSAFLIFIALVLVFAEPIRAAAPQGTPSIFVDADQYSSHGNQIANLEGHVKIIRQGEQLTCDKAQVDMTTGQVVAEGNILFISPEEYIRAEKMEYNFNSKKGMIHQGFIQSGQQTIEGEEIFKAGDKEYEAKNATYTSCVNCPPAWKLSGSDIQATAGSYAYITNPVIRVSGIPVFWLPYIAIPIKNQRQSGLLAPTIGNYEGLIFGESYFWAIDPSRDATLSETHYDFRGWKTGLEYRYVNDMNSRGKFRAAYLDDSGFASDTYFTQPDARYNPLYQSTQRSAPSVQRYFLHYDHRYELPDNFVNNMDLNWVSDSVYPRDFQREVPYLGDAALENRISLTKNSENTHSSIDLDFYENLLKADPVGGNDDAVHRAPEIKYSVMPTHIFDSNLRAGVDFDYVNFARANQTYDEVNGSPGFQTGDRYRTGQRLIVRPGLTYPINVADTFDLVPQASYEEDFYQFGYSDSPTASRRSVRTSLSARTRLSAIFGDDTSPLGSRYKHEIIPDITYTYVPWLYQEDHPFLVGPLAHTGFLSGTYLPHYSSQQPITEFDNLQFDYRDRLADLNLITMGFTNILIQKKYVNGESQYRQIVRHQLTQSYDFYTAYGPDVSTGVIKQPWSEIRSLLDVKLDNLGVNSDVSYYPYQNAAISSTSVSVRDSRGNGVTAGYSQTFGFLSNQQTGLSTSQVDISSSSEFANLSIYLVSKYFELSGAASYDILQSHLASVSTDVLLKPPGNCWGLQMTYIVPFGGKPNFTASIPIYFGNGQGFSVGKPQGI